MRKRVTHSRAHIGLIAEQERAQLRHSPVPGPISGQTLTGDRLLSSTSQLNSSGGDSNVCP
jgi:hypothetical protein